MFRNILTVIMVGLNSFILLGCTKNKESNQTYKVTLHFEASVEVIGIASGETIELYIVEKTDKTKKEE